MAQDETLATASVIKANALVFPGRECADRHGHISALSTKLHHSWTLQCGSGVHAYRHTSLEGYRWKHVSIRLKGGAGTGNSNNNSSGRSSKADLPLTEDPAALSCSTLPGNSGQLGLPVYSWIWCICVRQTVVRKAGVKKASASWREGGRAVMASPEVGKRKRKKWQARLGGPGPRGSLPWLLS